MDINKKIRIFKKPSISITLKQIFIIVTVVMSVICLLSLTVAAFRFVKVGKVEVVGFNPYEDYEIIKTSGIKKSDYWNAVDTKAVEEKLFEECPLIETVKVSRKFPNKIEIDIESRKVSWYVEIGEPARKYTLDSSLTVIGEMKNTGSATRLVLPNVQSVFEREVPVFGQSVEERTKTLEIIEVIRKSPLYSRITELDVKDRTQIKIVIDGQYTAELGNKTNLELKLNQIIKAFEKDERVKNSNAGHFYCYPDGTFSFGAL